MVRVESKNDFDYYAYVMRLDDQKVSYYFEVRPAELPASLICGAWCRKLMNIMISLSFPEWAKGAVMYQIFVDRFYNGDPSNDVETDEYSYIGDPVQKVRIGVRLRHHGCQEFYGGDLQGVMDKLDYLQDLGVEVIYFNPLFVSPCNHKYDIQDYDYIDPHYGKIVVMTETASPESGIISMQRSISDRVTDKRESGSQQRAVCTAGGRDAHSEE